MVDFQKSVKTICPMSFHNHIQLRSGSQPSIFLLFIFSFIFHSSQADYVTISSGKCLSFLIGLTTWSCRDVRDADECHNIPEVKHWVNGAWEYYKDDNLDVFDKFELDVPEGCIQIRASFNSPEENNLLVWTDYHEGSEVRDFASEDTQHVCKCVTDAPTSSTTPAPTEFVIENHCKTVHITGEGDYESFSGGYILSESKTNNRHSWSAPGEKAKILWTSKVWEIRRGDAVLFIQTMDTSLPLGERSWNIRKNGAIEHGGTQLTFECDKDEMRIPIDTTPPRFGKKSVNDWRCEEVVIYPGSKTMVWDASEAPIWDAEKMSLDDYILSTQNKAYIQPPIWDAEDTSPVVTSECFRDGKLVNCNSHARGLITKVVYNALDQGGNTAVCTIDVISLDTDENVFSTRQECMKEDGYNFFVMHVNGEGLTTAECGPNCDEYSEEKFYFGYDATESVNHENCGLRLTILGSKLKVEEVENSKKSFIDNLNIILGACLGVFSIILIGLYIRTRCYRKELNKEDESDRYYNSRYSGRNSSIASMASDSYGPEGSKRAAYPNKHYPIDVKPPGRRNLSGRFDKMVGEINNSDDLSDDEYHPGPGSIRKPRRHNDAFDEAIDSPLPKDNKDLKLSNEEGSISPKRSEKPEGNKNVSSGSVDGGSMVDSLSKTRGGYHTPKSPPPPSSSKRRLSNR